MGSDVIHVWQIRAFCSLSHSDLFNDRHVIQARPIMSTQLYTLTNRRMKPIQRKAELRAGEREQGQVLVMALDLLYLYIPEASAPGFFNYVS